MNWRGKNNVYTLLKITMTTSMPTQWMARSRRFRKMICSMRQTNRKNRQNKTTHTKQGRWTSLAEAQKKKKTAKRNRKISDDSNVYTHRKNSSKDDDRTSEHLPDRRVHIHQTNTYPNGEQSEGEYVQEMGTCMGAFAQTASVLKSTYYARASL